MGMREQFEAWYRKEYWDFRYGDLPEIWVEEKQQYRHLDVQLAWASWQESMKEAKVKFELDRLRWKLLLNARY